MWNVLLCDIKNGFPWLSCSLWSILKWERISVEWSVRCYRSRSHSLTRPRIRKAEGRGWWRLSSHGWNHMCFFSFLPVMMYHLMRLPESKTAEASGHIFFNKEINLLLILSVPACHSFSLTSGTLSSATIKDYLAFGHFVSLSITALSDYLL